MAVNAYDFIEQFFAKAIHHRQDDDERGDAQHNADKRKAGDYRNEPFATARAQIAQRHHPFEQ